MQLPHFRFRQNTISMLSAYFVLFISLSVSGQELPKTSHTKDVVHGLEHRLAQLTHKPIAGKLAAPYAGIKLRDDGKVVVIIEPLDGSRAADIDSLGLVALGAEILAQSKSLIRAAIPVDQLLSARDVTGVQFIRTPYHPLKNSATSEGVGLINADNYHRNGLLGAGTKVAIIDPGFTNANRLSSDMPETWETRDFTEDGMYRGGVHGSGCAEIVYDIAPKAELHLLRIGDLVDLENAKDYCIAHNIDIVNYSSAWVGTGFGDGRGFACEIVDDAEENGILWVNSAGNYAQSQYSGFWSDGNSNNLHDFAPGDEIISLENVTAGDTVDVWLTWNEWPTTDQDYDLFLYRTDGTTFERIAESSTTQRNSKPVERVEHVIQSDGEYGVAIWKDENARGTVVKVWSGNHKLSEFTSLIGHIASPADARGAFAVGAVAHFDWSRQRIAPYSSRGPTVDGRIKPDIVAPTQVSTASYPSGFAGTSAAAPHAAAAAALVLSGNPSMTPRQIAAVLTSNARDAGDPGEDNTFGFGLLSLPNPPSFDTSLHTVWDGWWEIDQGRIESEDKTWQFNSYGITDRDSIAVTGIVVATVTNKTLYPLNMSYSVAFLDSNNEEIATRFVPEARLLTLDAGESRQIHVDFLGVFSDLSAVERVTRAALFGGFKIQAPEAAFEATPISGDAPLEVRFTNRSTGKIDEYLWGFGDGDISTMVNPTHTYNTPGTYAVTLTAKNPGGNGRVVQAITVRQAVYTASGRVTLAGKSNHSGVRIAFTKDSGSGTIPSSVTTKIDGTWSQDGFHPGTRYRATPSLGGWTFKPLSRPITQAAPIYNFLGEQAAFSVSGRVTLSGQSTHSGVRIAFTRVSGSGTIPPAVHTASNGTWSQNGFEPGTTYRAAVTSSGWTFTPASRQITQAVTNLNFQGEQAAFSTSGRITLTGQSNHSGVRIAFTRVSGSGSIPSVVNTSSSGVWFRNGFESGTTYRITPTRSGYSFTPGSRVVTSGSGSMDFTGTAAASTETYTISGRVTLNGKTNHSGVIVNFRRVSGSGAIPSRVITSANGSWTRSGFTRRSTYEVTPTYSGWTFTPENRTVIGSVSTLNFRGSETNQHASIPSSGFYGYAAPSVTGQPKVASFQFDTEKQDLLLSWELISNEENAISIWLNGSFLWSIPGSSTSWKTWYGSIRSSRIRTSGNVLEFRHGPNANRTTGYDRWMVRNVNLWKSFNAKIAGARPIESPPQQKTFSIGLPYPSPFNSTVTIPVSVSTSATANVRIINLLGQHIATLHDGVLTPGRHAFTWNTKDENGTTVTTGLYIVILRSDDQSLTRKLVFMQ